MRITSAIIAVICLLLGGCDWLAQKELEVGVSTEAQVRKYMGKPDTVWEEPDGTQIYEYPKGANTYMIVLDKAGVFQRMTNVLIPEQFAKVTAGKTKEFVRRLLGKPSDIEKFKRLDQEVWSYKHVGQIDSEEFFHVYFDTQGQVVKTQIMGDDRPGNG